MSRESSNSHFTWPVRVYYEDTDSGGVVYYANYLKFMERARTEYLRSLGYEQDQLAQDYGLIFAVRSVNVDYLSPARFNDALQVTARMIERGRASLVFAQTITRIGEDRSLCTGEVKIACIDRETFRPRPIPREMLTEFIDAE